MTLELRETGPADSPWPFVLVHGARHGAWCFGPLAHALAELGLRCVAPSLRGHGGSLGRERLAEFGLAEYLDDVLETLVSIAEPLILVGHSMGGALAQRAGMHPLVEALVLLASVPPDGVRPVDDIWLARTPGALAWLRDSTGAPPEGLFFSSQTPAPEQWLARLEQESPRVVEQLRSAQVEATMVSSSLSIPVVVVGAREDALLPPTAVERTAVAYGVEPRWVDAGHNLVLEPDARPILVDILVSTRRQLL